MDHVNGNLYYALKKEIRRLTNVHSVTASSIGDEPVFVLSGPRNMVLHTCERFEYLTDRLPITNNKSPI